MARYKFPSYPIDENKGLACYFVQIYYGGGHSLVPRPEDLDLCSTNQASTRALGVAPQN